MRYLLSVFTAASLLFSATACKPQAAQLAATDLSREMQVDSLFERISSALATNPNFAAQVTSMESLTTANLLEASLSGLSDKPVKIVGLMVSDLQSRLVASTADAAVRQILSQMTISSLLADTHTDGVITKHHVQRTIEIVKQALAGNLEGSLQERVMALKVATYLMADLALRAPPQQSLNLVGFSAFTTSLSSGVSTLETGTKAIAATTAMVVAGKALIGHLPKRGITAAPVPKPLTAQATPVTITTRTVTSTTSSVKVGGLSLCGKTTVTCVEKTETTTSGEVALEKATEGR